MDKSGPPLLELGKLHLGIHLLEEVMKMGFIFLSLKEPPIRQRRVDSSGSTAKISTPQQAAGRRTKMAMCYDAGTLAMKAGIEDLMMQDIKIKYDVIGLTLTGPGSLNAVFEIATAEAPAV
ncbi:hypothetical protein V3C99_018538 [Haemonchus contortus]|uniref:PFK domain-containing protein n=1 Tax=Haemonchus contortus TaxID=6289 RepID=A0A7I4Z211_HAECO|nr:unnamed protein product [Haemonchus contortus]